MVVDPLACLQALTAEAIRDFRTSSLHNVRLDGPPLDVARIAARQIAKYGGVAGLRLAARIEDELRAFGVVPWR